MQTSNVDLQINTIPGLYISNDNIDTSIPWSNTIPINHTMKQQVSYMDSSIGFGDFMAVQPLPTQGQFMQPMAHEIHPLNNASFDMMYCLNPGVPSTLKEEKWTACDAIPIQPNPHVPGYQTPPYYPPTYPILPPTPTETNFGQILSSIDEVNNSDTLMDFCNLPISVAPPNLSFQPSRELTPPPLTYSPPQHMIASTTASPNNVVTPHGLTSPVPNRSDPKPKRIRASRRKSSNTRRRKESSDESVASQVSLTRIEPVSYEKNGIEYLRFCYSRDRVAEEYNIRTDIATVSLEDIPTEFRIQNTIYHRANVPRENYEGNRWEYETCCNRLGWELCWLNKEILCGHRGLIQRAVDSYRNRHANMRSRRVTRQEKVANGTLRQRRVNKSHSVS